MLVEHQEAEYLDAEGEAERIRAELAAEHGIEVFIGEGYAAGGDLVVKVAEALREAYRRGIADA